MKMSKIACLVISAVLSMSLVACGGNDSNKEQQPQQLQFIYFK